MKLGTRCTVCGDRVTDSNSVKCDDCGRPIHDRCTTYEQAFECQTSGEDLWIGAVEL